MSKIKQKWDEADATEASAESLKWEVAGLLAEAHESGKTQTQLAQETGRDKRRVGEYIEVHRRFVHVHGDKTFNQCWTEVRGYTQQSENDRVAASHARRSLRDPAQRRRVIESLDIEEREELVREVSRSVAPAASSGREEERDLWKDVQDAPKHDLSAQAAKLVATASQIEVVLADGAEFRRMDAKELRRLHRDLDRVKDTADRLQEQIDAQSKVRRIA